MRGGENSTFGLAILDAIYTVTVMLSGGVLSG